MLFIKKVYRYSKPLGIGMLFFVVVQLFCFYKGGMVFSPWYNYGMYSSVIKIEPVYEVNTVSDLQGSSYSPQRWDKIHYTLQQQQALNKNDSLYETEVKRIFSKLHLLVTGKGKFISPITENDNWFKKYVLGALSIWKMMWKVTSNNYNWNGEILDATQTNLAK